MDIERFSIGIGDRFGHQGAAQLRAFELAAEKGIKITPVWNKSNREHGIIGTTPADTRKAAASAVAKRGWKANWRVDADHIGLGNVDKFIESSDFFTIDVADFIRQPATPEEVASFTSFFSKYVGKLSLPAVNKKFDVDAQMLESVGQKYIKAVEEAGKVYRRIEQTKGSGKFIVEVSMDEANLPQTPTELFFILGALAREKIPVQTIAPKFSGRFNKGVDYVGDPAQFEQEFENDIAAVAFARSEFGLAANLKLSVHSGSDKFSIYAPIRKLIERHGAGLHLKTAGTTWLEEVAGLAAGSNESRKMVCDIYAKAHSRFDELCAPYATVIDINRARLPEPADVARWSDRDLVAAIRHDPANKKFDPNLRQLLHVGYKVAAELGQEFHDAVIANEKIIGDLVTDNLWTKHIKPLFVG